ncbi:MAG: RNA polymerase sigma factor [Bacteroidales bacterium]|nr:RNA polymerase sigma factor [Bacteroidales bacterium]
MPVTKEIISQCKKDNEKAREIIFNKYSPVLLSICIRYLKDRVKAEDVMQDAFIIIFTKINQYNGKGSFEGWIKRITVNTALMQLRKDKKEIVSDSMEYFQETTEKNENERNLNLKDKRSVIENAKFSQTEIFDIVSELPTGFRTVFNLYVVEGYKHKEISKELKISIGTSKSQLLRARKKLESILYIKALYKLKNKITNY